MTRSQFLRRLTTCFPFSWPLTFQVAIKQGLSWVRANFRKPNPLENRDTQLVQLPKIFYTVDDLRVRSRHGKVTDYRDETGLPDPEEAELLAKGTGESCCTAPYGSMPH
jgi:hypothetical protein